MKLAILTISYVFAALLAMSSNVYAGGIQGGGDFKLGGNFTSTTTAKHITQTNIGSGNSEMAVSGITNHGKLHIQGNYSSTTTAKNITQTNIGSGSSSLAVSGIVN
jgi:hypothetical protein